MTKLIGTAPNQVPTNADLGSLAYVDHDNVNLTTADLKLKALSKTKNTTAVDVFVYDTSQDTDGGAWRHRTQHTSWYNEGASSTRGSRKEFPAVAVIVAEANKVTIYDADDPSLPMWMAFNTGAGNALYINASSSPTAVNMLNGELYVGLSNGLASAGLNNMSFVADTTSLRITTTVKYNVMTIADRNRGGATTIDGSFTAGIVNRDVNDIAMTVLPNAPTNPATGLPVPTIAVATDGGLSVINNDGTVYDSSYTGGLSDVGFWADGTVVYGQGGFTAQALRAEPSAYQTADGFGTYILHGSLSLPTYFPYQSGLLYLPFGDNEVAGGNPSGTTSTYSIPCLGRYVMGSTLPQSMGCVTTSSYTTGWMNGDIKLAALADTTAGTLAGSELVTDFSTYADQNAFDVDWTRSASATFSNGTLVLTSAAFAETTSSNIGYTAGTPVVVTLDVTVTSGTVEVWLGGTASFDYQLITTTSSGTFTFTGASTGTDGHLYVRSLAAGTTASISNISVRLADPDRSVNGKGIGVHGSITKAAVATGADVVGYSNFSSSNYLEQPYNADLDFGTGDFCVMGWLKTSEVGNDYIVDCRNTAATVGFLVLVDANGVLYFSAQNAATGNVTGTVDVTSDTWRHFACVRSNSGTDYSIFVDGQLDTTSVDTAEDVDSTDRILRVGTKVNGLLKFAGSLALLRISATAPTAEQIAKIYEDEKFLFQENAKATLYGTSDAVTALAYDDKTQLLHVGTSSGRSEFQGLRRINNTETGITTAISVSDNLVVEQ